MREHAWAGRLGRRKVRTTIPDKTAAPARDLVKRQFSPAEPNQTWCGDITYSAQLTVMCSPAA
jgi:transposase InsO family protein